MSKAPKSPRRIAVAGASGFIGSALVRHLEELGHSVTRIGRQEDPKHGHIRWNPAGEGLDPKALDGIRIVINATGEDIGQRWTPERRRMILESRVQTTAVLAQACARMEPRPNVLVNMSAIGFYGDQGDEVVNEESPGGTGFLADVVRAWEAAAVPAHEAGIRVVHARCGVVLHPSGGMLRRLLPFFRLGAGGTLGSGRQWMSWISRTDLLRALSWLALHESLEGPINVASPNPVTNAEFTRALARAVRRPALAPLPAVAIRFMFGEMGEATLLSGQRVAPVALSESGFEFLYPMIEAALSQELNKP